MFEIHTIVCPTDFSDGSARAIEHALALAKTHGAAVHVIHVSPIQTYVVPDLGPLWTPDVIEELRRGTALSLEKIAARYREAGSIVSTAALDGSPAEEINRYAEKVGADLVVLGTHGRRGLPRMFLGSVAERIVRTSAIPVLTVRFAKSERAQQD